MILKTHVTDTKKTNETFKYKNIKINHLILTSN